MRVHPDTIGHHIWPDADALPDGTVGSAWADEHLSGEHHIFYSASTDAGQVWFPPEQVDTRTTGTISRNARIEFTPAGIPIAVWEDDREGTFNVYFSKRDPGNPVPWQPEIRINTAGCPSEDSNRMRPSLAVLDEERYFIAWSDCRDGRQVYMRGTRDGGLTWTPEVRVNDPIGGVVAASDPCMIANPDSGPIPGAEILYCVTNDWRAPDSAFPNVVFYRSVNGGASWSAGVRVNDITLGFQQTSAHCLVCLDDGTLTAGWFDNDVVHQSFRTAVSTDQGEHWSASAQVDDPGLGERTGTYSAIVGAGAQVFAGFDSKQGDDRNCYFRPSSDGGRTWTEATVRIDDDETGAFAQNPVLAAVNTDAVLCVWQDTRPGTSNLKIYSSRGTRVASGLDDQPPSGIASARHGVRCDPNPSRAPDLVRLRIPDSGAGACGAISISDAGGRTLRRLQISGREMTWDGRDSQGRLMPDGTYWVRMEGIPGARATRVVRLRIR